MIGKKPALGKSNPFSPLTNLTMKKHYFRTTFSSGMMGNRDIKGYKFVCVGIKFLAFSVLLRIKSEQKVVGN